MDDKSIDNSQKDNKDNPCIWELHFSFDFFLSFEKENVAVVTDTSATMHAIQREWRSSARCSSRRKKQSHRNQQFYARCTSYERGSRRKNQKDSHDYFENSVTSCISRKATSNCSIKKQERMTFHLSSLLSSQDFSHVWLNLQWEIVIAVCWSFSKKSCYIGNWDSETPFVLFELLLYQENCIIFKDKSTEQYWKNIMKDGAALFRLSMSFHDVLRTLASEHVVKSHG